MSNAANSRFKVLIIGAGSGGISVAARLRRHITASDIAIIDPSDVHYYQPLWTLAGAGVVAKETTARSQASVIPSGVQWIRDRVVIIDPEAKSVTLTENRVINFDYLVVATGLRLAWEKIPGVEGNLGKNGLCTNYQYDQVDKAAQMIEGFQGGTAIFTMPPVPIKCAGAPQKIMYLADDVFRKNGVRHKSKIVFATAGKAMFGIPIFSQALDKVVARKEIQPLFQHKLISVNAANKTARFATVNASGAATETELVYDLLHVVPPMMAHDFITASGLANTEGDQKGWLAVDKFTLQHLKYKNIYGIGDVTGVPNSKTGAAVRMQAPVVTENLLCTMGSREPSEKYDGYSSCPLVTGIGTVILAEFGYDGKLMPSFPIDPTVERHSMYILKKDILPKLYWYGMLKGFM